MQTPKTTTTPIQLSSQKPNSRRRFLGLAAVTVGFIAIEASRSLSRHLNQVTLQKVLDKLKPEFKHDLINNLENINPNMQRLLEILTHNEIQPPNKFLRNARKQVQGFEFVRVEKGPDCLVDYQNKKFLLNFQHIYNSGDNEDKKLTSLLALLFCASGVVSLADHFKTDDRSRIINQLFCNLIALNILHGIKSYNFDEIQCSTPNQLGLNGNNDSDLHKIIKIATQDPAQIKTFQDEVVKRMQSLGLDNRSNGALSSF